MNENTTTQSGLNFGSFTLVHKLDLDGLLINSLILAAVYAGFRIIEAIITAALTK